MTTLTNSADFTVGDSATTEESTTLLILPAISTQTGRGRLVHPSLGTYDYPYAPDEWSNIDGDAIIRPVWSSAKTLLGTANTLHQGHLRDVQVEERWISDISGDMDFVRMLAAFWMNPPDPSVAHVLWYPNYTTTLGYKVIITDLLVNGEGFNLSYISRQGWVQGTIVLRMRIAGRV